MPATSVPDRPPSPILRKLLYGTFWLGLKSPLQVVIAFWSIPLIQHAIGHEANGAFVFAWGFGFLQWVLEFGMNSALQRQVTEAWTRGDRAGVNRLIACGMTFYAVMSLVQIAVLGSIATFGLPPKFQGDSRQLIVGLLWLQALSAPFFCLLTVISSVLQAARRYEFLPRLDLVVIVLRFAVLILGLRAGIDFFAIVVAQLAVQLSILLIPSLWVMVRELGFVPHFGGAGRDDYASLLHISVYVFLIQLSIVLGDKVDTTVLGYALPDADPGPSITIYQNVSKPFMQIRQTGWTLAHLVLPAVASLAAARDESGLERIAYDGPRLLVGALLPVALLAGIYARPFLSLWVGPRYAPYAPLLQLFLVATLPLVLWVHAQMAIGMGRAELIALPLLIGSLVNLPLSYVLTARLGVSGVIWGTVLTTLISNLLVPGIPLFRLLKIRVSTFFLRTLSAPLLGAAFLIATTRVCGAVLSPDPTGTTLTTRSIPLAIHLSLGTLAYLAGYLAAPVGRADLAALARLRRR